MNPYLVIIVLSVLLIGNAYWAVVQRRNIQILKSGNDALSALVNEKTYPPATRPTFEQKHLDKAWKEVDDLLFQCRKLEKDNFALTVENQMLNKRLNPTPQRDCAVLPAATKITMRHQDTP